VVLLVVIGGGMLVTAVSALGRSGLAGPSALVMGAVLLVWGTVETLAIGYRGVEQLVLVALFVAAPALLLLRLGWDSVGPRRDANPHLG
jgi:hypothetical protein